MPTYAEELAHAQLSSLRLACLLAAPILVAFALLDRAFAPGSFVPLLGLRLAAALLLLGCARLAEKQAARPVVIAFVAVGLIAATVEVATFFTGGVAGPYIFSTLILQAGVAMLVPLRWQQAALLNAEALAIALVPLVTLQRPGNVQLAVIGSYLATMAVVSVAGAGLQDRLRRREHTARGEFARHAGLLNLGTLAGGLAHELSNPLNALGLQVEMLSRDPDPSHSEKRVEKIKGNLERMRNILEAMRNGARLSGGDRRPVDLAREADLAFTLMETRLRRRANLVRAYAELPPVFCQPTLLGQVLVNLLANAADAVSGKAEPRIALRVRRDGPHAVVEVEDNGPGVPEELRTRIFEPFFSTKGDSGNGLGLWISSEIARVHGGALSVARGSFGGALFRLELPIDPRSAPPEEQEQPAQAG